MRQNLDEIKTVFEKHEYSINMIVFDLLKKFKFKSLICNCGFSKASGYKVSEIVVIMLVLPLMLLKSVHSLYKSEYSKVAEMKRDTIYRLKNNENMPWRRLLYSVAKRFQQLVNPQKYVDPNSAFIVDDTPDMRVGYNIENISIIHNHTLGKKSSVPGFKNLMLGHYDGKSIIPIDFSIHKEKVLPKSKRKAQFKKEYKKNSNGGKRRIECNLDKITNSLNMIKRAVKNGFKAKYVLNDSWFTSRKYIKTIRSIKDGGMHLIAGIKRDKRKYTYNGIDLNGKELLNNLKTQCKEKRNRKWNVRYFEVTVNYDGIGEVKLFLCRFPYQKNWRIFISTDTGISFVRMMEVYSIRWTIEVMFKELKQHLALGKCQSRDFDAQIADITLKLILYTLLAYLKRISEYESLGALFEYMNLDMSEKTLSQRIWELIDELLQVAIDLISKSGKVDLKEFKNSNEYKYLKELFELSFLGNQLKKVG